MELLYLTDISQLNYLFDKNPLLLEKMHPITGDIVVAYELERRNIPFIDEWDFLQPVDIERNLETANNLSKTWWDENTASTEYEGIPLSGLTGNDLIYPFEACLNARTVYEKLFQTYNITKISGYFLPAIGVFRTEPMPTHRAVRSVVQAVLFWLADKNNIPVIHLKSEYPLSRGLLIKKRKFPSAVFKGLSSKKQISETGKIALVFYDLIANNEFLAITTALIELPEWQIVFISKRELDYCFYLINKGENVNKLFCFPRSVFEETMKSYHGPYPEIFANPHLMFQFKRIWEEMGMAADLGNIVSTFLDILQPSLILFGHEAFTMERVFVHLAKKKNIHTVSLVHDGLGYRVGFNGIVGDADSVLVWSHNSSDILKSFGVDETRLHKIGSIRYELQVQRYIQKLSSPEPEQKNRAKHHLGLPVNTPAVVIITAAINTGFSGPIANPRKHREAINELIELIKARKDLQFIIKAHPGYDYYELYRKMLELNLPNLSFPETRTLDEVLDASDICLLINYFTTGALEAMLHRVPVIYWNNAVYNLPEWNDYLPDFILNRINSIQELGTHIDKLMHDSFFRENTLIENEKSIYNILDINERSATNRFIDFIKSTQTVNHPKNGLLVKLIHSVSEQQTSNKIKEILADNFPGEIVTKYAVMYALYSFSFIAGTNNLGMSGLSKIFRVFQNHFGNENVSSWNEIFWPLYYIYISGYNKNSSSKYMYSPVIMTGMLFLNPKKFSGVPLSLKYLIIKNIAKAMAGNIRTAVKLL